MIKLKIQMSLTLVIDTREHALIAQLRQEHIPITVTQLALGDIWLCVHDDITQPLLMIERKRTDDLVASIYDGRWREQKARMIRTGLPVFYIIEGTINNTTALSAIVNTIIRDHIPVLRSDSVAETVRVIVHLQTKWASAGNHVTPTGIRAPIISKRKRLADHTTVYLRQLMCLSGVSENIARAIATVYPSLPALQSVLQTNPTAMYRIPITGSRKIGAKLTMILCKGLLGLPYRSPPEISESSSEVKESCA